MEIQNILDQIKLDGDNSKNKILKNAELEIKAREEYLNTQIKQIKDDYKNRLKEEKKAIKQTFSKKLDFELKKLNNIYLEHLLNELREELIKSCNNLPKKDKVKFVNTILKSNASVSDKVYVNFDDLKLDDIKKLEIVKKLKLKIYSGENLGIIIENKDYEINFLLKDMAQDVISKNQNHILKTLKLK